MHVHVRSFLQPIFGPRFGATGAFHVDVLGALSAAGQNGRAILLHDEKTGTDDIVSAIGIRIRKVSEREHERGAWFTRISNTPSCPAQ
jgi:hypothetical protein